MKAYGQTVLPDMSVLIGQKLVEIPKFKCDILSNFQTMCLYSVFMALNNPHIDYCSLDIEGAEAAILKSQGYQFEETIRIVDIFYKKELNRFSPW